MWTSRNIKLALIIPFIIGGSLYSYFALTYMFTLPGPLHQPIDLVYCVIVSFVDMGTTFAITSITILNLASKLYNCIFQKRPLES